MDDIPKEVEAIALKWGGACIIPPTRTGEGRWRFSASDAMEYEVVAPGAPFACFEDDGRPCGDVVRDDWCVRATTSAPDDWFTVAADGTYEAWSGAKEKIW